MGDAVTSFSLERSDRCRMGVCQAVHPPRQARRPTAVCRYPQSPERHFYVLSTGCQCNAIPSDLPPSSTVWDYLDLWEWDGTIARLHDALYVESREHAGRAALANAVIGPGRRARGRSLGSDTRFDPHAILISISPRSSAGPLVGAASWRPMMQHQARQPSPDLVVNAAASRNLACRRQANRTLGATSLRRATSATVALGSRLSARILIFSSRDQRRRESIR